MRINSLHIYGFGKWIDQKIDFNHSSFITIVGDNETGKSTIRSFILFMLFGLSPQQRQHFLPKHGGQLGGKLSIVAADGNDYMIERFHDRNNCEAICYDQAGQRLPSDWLTNQLHGVDRSLYNKIFNFDVFSLQVEGGLSKDQLGQVLLSVGMTGSDRIYQAEKQLQTVIQTIFRPRGTKPELNQILKQLIDKERQLKQLEDSIAIYEKSQKQRMVYQNQIAAKQEELAKENEQFVLFKEQERIYQSIEDYHLVVEQLKQLPDTVYFPEQGEKRYQSLKEQLQPLQTDQRVAAQKLIELKEELEQIQAQLLPTDIRNQLVNRLDEIANYQSHFNEYQQLERQIAEKTRMIKEGLGQSKLNITEADLLDLPINFTTKEIWQQLADQYTRLTEQVPNLDQSLLKLEKNEQQLTTKLNALKEKTLSTVEKNILEKELEQMDRTFVDSPGKKSNPFNQFQKKNRYLNFISISVMFLSLALMIFNRQEEFLILPFVIIFIVGCFILFKPIKFKGEMIEALEKQAEQESEQSIKRRDDLIRRIAQHDENRDAVLLIQQELKQINIEKMKLTEQLAILTMENERMEQSIYEQQDNFSFLAHIPVEFWPDLAKQLIEVIDLIEQRQQLDIDRDRELVWLNSFEEKIRANFADLIQESQLSFQQVLNQLQELSIQQQNFFVQEQRIQQRISQQEGIHNEIRAKMAPLQEEMEGLLEKVGVETEEQWTKLAQQYERWSILKEQKAELIRQIKLHLPDHLVGNILAGQYDSLSQLEIKIKTSQVKMTELNQELNSLYQKEAEQQAILKQQEQSKKVLNLKHDYYFIKEKFNEEAKRWLTYQLALEQIQQTKERFQRSYLPFVLEKATHYLNEITDGRYVLVEFDQTLQQLYLLTNDGDAYQANELSQGTLDQLFVAIRLGISSWLAKHIQLPFLIDDGFVHFDSNRQKQIYAILKDLKDIHQIIYFTKENSDFVQDRDREDQSIIYLS
ncbi:AAA family ATPase [Amphibacillus sp. MSJ-3]|uniref:ATP-binding protein n=1 Tax=Amphibacillus sp. MSJ-3 TaxID=2841505 RepID=UPI001C0EFCDD|nr:AAA family ATPase [Amphibacillus sp. MSJ-3]MBU5593996.1 AAA family ATPase [Amphibacillus sp. MSJ-3]